MRPIYIWQQRNWPDFAWDDAKLSFKLGRVRSLQGKLVGKMSVLGFEVKNNAVLNTLTADITKSSEIEGEILNADRYVDGVVQVLFPMGRNGAYKITVADWRQESEH